MKNYFKRFLIIFALVFGLMPLTMQVHADTMEGEWRGELSGTSEGDKRPPEFFGYWNNYSN